MKKSLLLKLTCTLSVAALGTISVVPFNAFADTDPVTVNFIRAVPVNSFPEDSSWIDSGRVVIVLQKTGQRAFPGNCGTLSNTTFDTYDAVVLRPDSGGFFAAAFRIEAGSRIPHDLKPGDKIVNFSSDFVGCCLDSDDNVISCGALEAVLIVRLAEGELVIPRTNSSPLLFTAAVDLTADSMGVITGQQSEDGFAEVVLTSQGQKPTFTTLWTNEWLEPADKIVDIVKLDVNPDTGTAWYAAFLEY